MIEYIFEDLCNNCNACVIACPTNVLDPAQQMPQIARLDQCQTCFMCELYCEQDAIYVGPDQRAPEPIDPEAIRNSGSLGKLRRDYEWNAGSDEVPPLRVFWQLGPLLMEGAHTAELRYMERHPEWKPLPPRR